MITIQVVSYWHDGHDGGGSTVLYNSLEELRKDLFTTTRWDTPEQCESKFQSALNGDNPYEDGEISNTTITVEYDADNVLRLTKPLHIHYGQ